jgi:hypothetical protein
MNLNSQSTLKSDNLCIELTYFPDTLSSIKSYYIMTQEEYLNLKTLHMDIYIENFINNEDLTKDKLDIHIVSNINNIKIFKNFIELFGNSFDIINLINIKKNNPTLKTNPKLKSTLKTNLTKKISKSESDSDFSSDSMTNILNDSIIRPKITNTQLQHISSSESDDYINSLTEIIDTYNKSKNIDETKLNKISQTKPEIFKDVIISELIKAQQK